MTGKALIAAADRAALEASISRIIAFGQAESRLEKLLAAWARLTPRSPAWLVESVARDLEAAGREWQAAAGNVQELLADPPTTAPPPARHGGGART